MHGGFDGWLCVAAQVLFNKETEAILGVHIIGLHAADLIQECSNAVAAGTTVRELSMMVRAFCGTGGGERRLRHRSALAGVLRDACSLSWRRCYGHFPSVVA